MTKTEEERELCPCEEASADNCEDCQDLPRGTFECWRALERATEKKAAI